MRERYAIHLLTVLHRESSGLHDGRESSSRSVKFRWSGVSRIETTGKVLFTMDHGAVGSQTRQPESIVDTSRDHHGAVGSATEFREGQNRSNIGC